MRTRRRQRGRARRRRRADVALVAAGVLVAVAGAAPAFVGIAAGAPGSRPTRDGATGPPAWRVRLESAFDAAREDPRGAWDPRPRWRGAFDVRWRVRPWADAWAKAVARGGDGPGAGAGRVRIEQADVRWSRADSSLAARVFLGTRTFFTGEITARLVDDDAVARASRRFGVRAHAGRGALGAEVIVAALEDAEGRIRRLSWLRAMRAGRRTALSVSWRDDAPVDAPVRRTLQAEAMLLGRAGRVALAWAQQGARALPGARLHWNAWVGDNFAALAPSNARVAVEARLAGRRVRDVGDVDVIARYRMTGPDYVDDLAGDDAPGTVRDEVVVAFAHARRALDLRAAWRRLVRWREADVRDEALVVTAAARLAHGADAYVRGALGTRRRGAFAAATRWISAGYTRRTGSMAAGLHGMWRRPVDAPGAWRTAVDLRLDLGRRTQLVARMVQETGRILSRSGVVALQVRPAAHAFAVIAWGRRRAADAPWPLEDADLLPGDALEDRVTVTLRGEF